VPPVPPCAMVTLVGESESVKLGAGVIVREMVVLAVVLPEVPVMVTVAVPVAAVPDAVRVSVEVAVPLAGGVTELGTNPAVTPLGKPEALSVVDELKPFKLVTVMVLVPFVPWTMVRVFGFAETVKVGAAVTVRVTVVVAVRLPEVPVIVMGYVPAATEPLAVRESVLVLVVGLGTKPAVTPVG